MNTPDASPHRSMKKNGDDQPKAPNNMAPDLEKRYI
jgi:hypothetical protein